MNPTITVTDAAADYIQKMLNKNSGIGFRLSVKKTGCSGYSYVPTIVEKENAADISCKIQNGVTLFIDAAWLSLLKEVHIDYIEEHKSGLKQRRLVFTNPKESSRCGCGESFHVKPLEKE